MKNNSSYCIERAETINTLETVCARFRSYIDKTSECAGFVDEETAAIVGAYVPAQLALLQLVKEESEENDHE